MTCYQAYNRIKNKLYHNTMVLRVYSFFMSDIPKSIQRKKLKKYGYRDLEKLTNVLDSIQVKSFCDFGTLLGIIRDGGFIDHDTDIDIGILTDSVPFDWNLLEHVLSEEGLRKIHYYTYNGAITEQTYEFSDGLSVDLFLYERYEDDTMRTFVYYKDHERIYDNASLRSVKALIYPMINGIETVQIRGCEFNIPSEPETRLRVIYGEDWKTPNPNYKPDRTKCIMNHLGEKHDSRDR